MSRPRLTRQQRARIAQARAARQQTQSAASTDLVRDSIQHSGQVIVRHGQSVVIRTPQGESILCVLRQHLDGIVCGDQVRWQATGADTGVIVALEPRTTVLSRPAYNGKVKPLAANITQMIVVLAPKPKPSSYLLDQYLIVAAQLSIRAVICLNKADLLTAAQQTHFRADFAHYAALGYPIIEVSCHTPGNLQPLMQHLAAQTSILVGQSGVGKSSLVSALSPESATIAGELSAATGLGRHTTSASTLYSLPNAAELIDSPGVRSFRLSKLTRQMLEHGYPELQALLGRCRFNDCQHRTEPGCVIQTHLADGTIHPERFANFQHMAQQVRLTGC